MGQQHTVIVDRITKFRPRWKQPAKSAATYKQKLHAIVSAAWPCMLHGVGSVHVGDDRYDDMRSQALKSLGESFTGTSLILRLSLLEYPCHDPAFHSLWETVCHVRTMIPFETAMPILIDLVVPSLRLLPPAAPASPSSLALGSLHLH